MSTCQHVYGWKCNNPQHFENKTIYKYVISFKYMVIKKKIFV